MNRREMKKELFAYLATYLEEYRYSDLSSQMQHHVIGDKPTEPAQRRFDRIRAEAITQLRNLAMPTLAEMERARQRRDSS